MPAVAAKTIRSHRSGSRSIIELLIGFVKLYVRDLRRVIDQIDPIGITLDTIDCNTSEYNLNLEYKLDIL
jgi:hypothetical protein